MAENDMQELRQKLTDWQKSPNKLSVQFLSIDDVDAVAAIALQALSGRAGLVIAVNAEREALRDIADPARLRSHGDPGVLREWAYWALEAAPVADAALMKICDQLELAISPYAHLAESVQRGLTTPVNIWAVRAAITVLRGSAVAAANDEVPQP